MDKKQQARLEITTEHVRFITPSGEVYQIDVEQDILSKDDATNALAYAQLVALQNVGANLASLADGLNQLVQILGTQAQAAKVDVNEVIDQALVKVKASMGGGAPAPRQPDDPKPEKPIVGVSNQKV